MTVKLWERAARARRHHGMERRNFQAACSPRQRTVDVAMLLVLLAFPVFMGGSK